MTIHTPLSFLCITITATIVKSGTIPNFENAENHSGKGNIYGSGDPINQRSAFAFNTGQNHTGNSQKKASNIPSNVLRISNYKFIFK